MKFDFLKIGQYHDDVYASLMQEKLYELEHLPFFVFLISDNAFE